MHESKRTITYVVAAAVTIGLALYLTPSGEMTPESLRIANVGKPFFDDFNPGEATSIEVFAYDEAKATPKAFGVKFDKGKWTIPSHHNYPADGADRLAKTATSVKGIKREELASSSPQNHEQFEVIDPNDEDKTKSKGRGKRITLKKGDAVLVDLIRGKEVKDRPGFFYLRKPGENETYIAKVSIDLSTKFADWVETDLLKLDKNDLSEMDVVLSFQAQNVNGRPQIVPGETNTLIHDKPTDPWKLEGIEEGEEVDTTKVTSMVTALDDLKLAGVRPKSKGFRPDLSLDPEFVKKQSDLDRLVIDLQSKGYTLVPDREKKGALKLFGDEGELVAATNKGAVYTLKFGAVFLGDESEIEIGSADTDKPAEKPKEDGAADDKDKPAAGKQPSRYLFVMVDFDEKYLGAPPEKPAPPEEVAAAADSATNLRKKAPKKASLDDEDDKQKSSADSPAQPDEKAADKKPDDQPPKESAPKDQSGKSESADENCFPGSTVAGAAASQERQKGEKSADEPATEKKDTDKNEIDKNDTDKKDAAEKDEGEKSKDNAPTAEGKSQPASQEEKKEEKKKSADELKKEYEAQLKKYEADLKAHQDKVAAGKKQVEELNARFSGWYYVISAENFNKLHVSRKELVKAKGKSADDKKADKTLEPKDEDGDEPVKDPLESLDEKDDKDAAKKPE